MQAVHQGTQLALCLGQACLLVQQVQFVLALVGQVLCGLFGRIHQLQTLLFQHFNIQFKHKGYTSFSSLYRSCSTAGFVSIIAYYGAVCNAQMYIFRELYGIIRQ